MNFFDRARMNRWTMCLAMLGMSSTPTSVWALPAGLPSEDSGISLANALGRLSDFMETDAGRQLFQGDFDVADFVRIADQVTFETTDQVLVDAFGEKRCLLNHPGSTVVRVNRSSECLTWLERGPAEWNTILLHEVLNMLLRERPVRGIGSTYEISKKLLSVDPARIDVAQKFVLHPSCEIWADQDALLNHAGVLQPIQASFLLSKGYTYRGTWVAKVEDKKPLLLRTRFAFRTAPGSGDHSLKASHKTSRLVFSIRLVKNNDHPLLESAYHVLHQNMSSVRFAVHGEGFLRGLDGGRWRVRVRDFESVQEAALAALPPCVKLPLQEARK